MNEPSSATHPMSVQATPANAPRYPRLRFPFLSLLFFWLVTLLLRGVDKAYFVGFMSSLALSVLATLTFLGWWWFNRRVRMGDKAAGFALIVLEAVFVGRFAHPSITS